MCEAIRELLAESDFFAAHELLRQVEAVERWWSVVQVVCWTRSLAEDGDEFYSGPLLRRPFEFWLQKRAFRDLMSAFRQSRTPANPLGVFDHVLGANFSASRKGKFDPVRLKALEPSQEPQRDERFDRDVEALRSKFTPPTFAMPSEDDLARFKTRLGDQVVEICRRNRGPNETNNDRSRS